MGKRVLQDRIFEKVSPSGYILNFLKFIDRPRETSPLEQWNNISKEICGLSLNDCEISRYVLKCINQYDVFRLSHAFDDVKAIDKILNQHISSFCISDRRFLCYSLDKDNSSVNLRDVLSNDNLVAVILLKINNFINLGSFFEENIAAKVFDQITKDYFPSIKYFILRTFANKEIFIVANAPNLMDLDSLVRILQGVNIYPGSQDKAFSIVNRWFCCNRPAINDETEFVGNLKLYGICNQTHDKKFQCLSTLPPEKDKDKRVLCSSEDEVIKAICNIDDSGKITYPSVKEVINKLFNMKCRDVPYCAVSCNLLLQHHKDVFSGKYNIHNYSFFNSESEAKPHLIKFHSDALLNELDKVGYMVAPGLEFHGIELKKVRKYIERKLRNHFQKTEYEDVLILLYNVIQLIKRDIEDRKRPMDDEELRTHLLDHNLAILNTALHILQHVCRERERPNICSTWFDDGYFKSEISGFSKICNSSSFLISSIVNRPWTDTPIDYQSICTFGYRPLYSLQSELSVINIAFQAVLAPKHHFGVFHEIGHILESTIRQNDSLIIRKELLALVDSLRTMFVEKSQREISNKFFFSELFADLVSYLYGINNLDVYLKNHVNIFLDNVLYDKIENDYPEYRFKSQIQIYRLVFIIIIHRLIGTEVSNFLLNDSVTYGVIREALHKTSTFLLDLKERRKDDLTIKLASICQSAYERFSGIVTQENALVGDLIDISKLAEDQKNYYIIFLVAKKLLELINRLGKFRAILDSTWRNNEDYVSVIMDENKIYTLEIDNPQKIIVRLLEKNDNCFSRNVATIVSLANNFDREGFLSKCLN